MTPPRSATLLTSNEISRLRTDKLTYAEVGQTAGNPPPGYTTFTKRITLPAGQELDATVMELSGWQVPLRAGLSVAASTLRVEPDAVLVMSIGVSWLARPDDPLPGCLRPG